MRGRASGAPQLRVADPDGEGRWFGPNDRTLAGKLYVGGKIHEYFQHGVLLQLLVGLKQYAGPADVHGPAVVPVRRSAPLVVHRQMHGEALGTRRIHFYGTCHGQLAKK